MIYYKLGDELTHHGILGMKWGVRRYQNPDGSLTSAGKKRYAYSYVKDAEEAYEKKMLKDPEYRKLSKKAFDAEKKKLLSEKPYIDNDDAYERHINSDQYWLLDQQSMDAKEAKDFYVKEHQQEFINNYVKNLTFGKNYLDISKKKKIEEIKLSKKDEEEIKEYIKDRFYPLVWDENLEYNPDNYYESWVDDEEFR